MQPLFSDFLFSYAGRVPGQLSVSPPQPLGEDPLSHWWLDPSITFLNHGCFGAAPRAVLEAQTRWREQLEARPVELLERRRDELLGRARETVGRFLGADPADLGFVTNATGGVNAVIRSLRFGDGDELLTTTHVYSAVRQTMRYLAGRAGARHVEMELPLPIRSPDDVVDAVAGALSERTRLLVIDHVTSPTAVLLPVGRIIELCAQRGVDVLVDGAHAPGMVDLDLGRLGPAYYTGNLHKWVCAPKGAALLWVRRDRHGGIHPNTISHFLDEGLVREFGWQGTRDITAWLGAAESIEFMERTFGWARLRRHNHELAVWAQALLAQAWQVEPGTPADGSMLGSMATVPLPPEAARRFESAETLQARLYEQYRIEVPVIVWGDRWWVRASCQVYNTPAQYERLAKAVVELTTP